MALKDPVARAAYEAARYRLHRDERRAYNAAYRAAHGARIAEQKAAWYAAHREHSQAVMAAWRRANPGRKAVINARWYARLSPDVIARRNMRRWLQRLEAGIARKEAMIRDILSQFPELEVPANG